MTDKNDDNPEVNPATSDLEPTIEIGSERAGPTFESVPEQIGPYRLTRELGRGGMGVVYLAEQTEPVRREVAIKLLGAGFTSERHVARFEAERQALAMMSHPNIAQVFDAGVDPQGRPYFVMELVRGAPITRFCDERQLGLEARLEMFLDVCAAVAHAHKKGVIHRDIKPTNVLIATDQNPPLPKVIDFGVAKAIESGSDGPGLTQVGTLIGTPDYMSPEQLAAEPDVDTRSDIYSLGVLLFQLLTGTLPVARADLKNAGLRAIQRAVLDTETPKPSERARERTTTTGKSAPASVESIDARRLRGELDWIVMKALSKERDRRYQTPQDLADDLRRHLLSEPVLAGPPSRTYRMVKFARRHRAAVTAAAAVLLALVVGTAGLAVGLVRSTRAEEVARAEAEAAWQISTFLLDVFKGANPNTAQGREPTATDLLDAGVARIRNELIDEPQVRGRLLFTMAQTYNNLSRMEQAEALLREAQEVFADMPEEAGMQAEIWAGFAHIHRVRNENEEAIAAAERARDLFATAGGEQTLGVAAAGTTLLDVFVQLERFEEARVEFDRAIALLEGMEGGEVERRRAKLYEGMAAILSAEGRYDESTAMLAQALATHRSLGPDTHPDVIHLLGRLGAAYVLESRMDEARAVLEEALDLGRQTFPEGSAPLSSLLVRYGQAVTDFETKAELYSEAMEIKEKIYGRRSVETAIAMNNLGLALSGLGEEQRAMDLRLEALSIFEEAYGAGHRRTETARMNLGSHYYRAEQYTLALEYYGAALRNLSAVVGETHPGLISPLLNVANCEKALGRYVKSQELHDRALEIATGSLQPNHRIFRLIHYNTGCLSAVQGKREETLEHLARAVEAGWDNPLFVEDEDLEWLHGDPEFDALAAVVLERAEAEGIKGSTTTVTSQR